MTIIFLELLLIFIQWESSTFTGSTITSNFRTVFWRSSDSVKSRTIATSWHPCLKTWQLLQHFFIFIILCSVIPFTSLVTAIYVTSFSNIFVTSLNSFLVFGKVESNLFWKSKTRMVIAYMESFIKAVLKSAIAINKKQLQVTYYTISLHLLEKQPLLGFLCFPSD